MSCKKNCIYPDCKKCVLSDCEVAYLAKRLRYWSDIKMNRQKQRDYRENQRIKLGKRTMKEIQLERQNVIYGYIVRFTEKNLYPPSTTEIQKEFGFTSNSDVSRDLRRLEDRGLIKIGKGYRHTHLLDMSL